MSEKVRIFEAEIELGAAVADTKRLKEEIELLRSQAKLAKEQQGELSEEYIGYTAALKSAQGELRRNENVTKAVIDANVANAGSINQLRSQLAIVTDQWNKLSAEERNNTKAGRDLSAQKLKLTEQLKAEERATGDARRNVGNYTESMGQATNVVGQYVPAAGKAAAAAKGLGVAFKVMLGPIGLIVAAIALVVGAIQSFFTSSEQGQDSAERLGAIFTTVFGNIIDVLSKFGEVIVNAFLKPKEAIQDLKNTINNIKDFFVNTFGNIIGGTIDRFVANFLLGFANLGLAWQKFKGLFTDNADEIAESQNRITELNDDIAASKQRVADGAKNLKDAVVNGYNSAKAALQGFIDEQKREIAIAQNIADRKAALRKREREAEFQNAKDTAEIAKLREQIADRENTSAEERLKLLDEAEKLEKQIEQRNIDIAKAKLLIKQEQNALSNSTIADLDEEAKLRADLFKVEEAAAKKRRELAGERRSAMAEIKAAEKASADAAIAELKRIADEEARIADEEKKRAIERAKLDFDNELALAESNLFAKLEVQRRGLEMQRQQEIEYAELIGADVNLVNEKYRQLDLQLEKIKTEAQFQIASSFAGGLAMIFGENTKLGKIAGVAQTLINTYLGAQAAFAQTPGGIIIKSAAAAIATGVGLANLRKIKSVNTNISKGGSGAGQSISAASVQTPVIPQIGAGIVGQQTSSSQANQLAQTLRDRPQPPVLVVESVTAKQDGINLANQLSTV